MPKKSNEIKENYFDIREELAVLEYLNWGELNLTDRDKIFNTALREPFIHMIECLIKTYVKDILKYATKEELIDDTLSFLLTKFSKFAPEKNKKAYSYYQTVCVNYLKTQLKKFNKERNRSVSYEDISSDLEEDEKLTYEIEIEEKLEIINFIPIVSSKIKEEIENNKKIKPNEKKVGEAIILILDNWEKMITNGEKSNILARNKILYEIREITFLTAKDVRKALNKYKILYKLLKNSLYAD